MKTKLLFLIGYVIFSLPIISISQNIEKTYRHFEGTISTYPIVVDMYTNKDTVYGGYYYEKVGIYIQIKGMWKKDNTVTFDEINGNLPTATFSGKYDTNKKQITGTWTKSDKSKTLDFTITENYEHSSKIAFYSIQNVKHIEDNPDYPAFTYNIFYELPVSLPNMSNYPKLKDNICHRILGNYYKDYQTGINAIESSLLESYQDGLMYDDNGKLDLENTWMYEWSNEGSTVLYYNDNDILCLNSSGWEYSGGAHGYYWTLYENFDLQTGDTLSFYDVFLKSKDNEIKNLLLEDIEGQDRTEDLYSIDEFYVSHNIAINKHGISFLYNAYEIGCYAVGQFECTFAYKDIKDLLTPKFKQRMGIQ